jgi:hypothetical protein
VGLAPLDTGSFLGHPEPRRGWIHLGDRGVVR